MSDSKEADRRRDEVIKRMLRQPPKDQKQLKDELNEKGHDGPKPGRPKKAEDC